MELLILMTVVAALPFAWVMGHLLDQLFSFLFDSNDQDKETRQTKSGQAKISAARKISLI